MLQFGMTANCSFFQADHFAIYPHFARIGCVGSHVILRRIGNVGSHVLTNALPGSHSHIPRSPGARIEQSVATFCDERSNICMAELPWNGKASSVSMNRVFGVGCARLPRKAPTFPTHNANVRWATKTIICMNPNRQNKCVCPTKCGLFVFCIQCNRVGETRSPTQSGIHGMKLKLRFVPAERYHGTWFLS